MPEVKARPAFVTLRVTDPRMGAEDGNGDLVRAVQYALRSRGIEQDGVYGPQTAYWVAEWQWRVGSYNYAGAITPDELLVLLGYRKLPVDWRDRVKLRKDKPNPEQPELPQPVTELRIIQRSAWCPFTPRGFSAVNWAPGVPHVIHWFGPGSAPDDDTAAIAKCVEFARYHQFTHGWSYFAYSYAILRSGLVLEGRGDNVRTAATGNSLGNTYPSVMLFCGTDTPEPTPIQYEVLQLLRERGKWGRRLMHSELSATSCPGPVISPWVQNHR